MLWTNRWDYLTRQYLALREEALLEQAIESAEQAGETDIAQLLKAFQAQEFATVDFLALILHLTLHQLGREEEAETVMLIHRDLRARLVEAFKYFPVDQQMAVLEAGLQACEQAIAIARALGDEPCTGLYLVLRGTGYAQSGRPAEAAKAYGEALAIYRRLAQAQPQVYEPDVAMTLNNLGTVLRHLRRLEQAEEAYTEALEIARRHDIPDQRAQTASNLGRLWIEQERWEEAVAVLKEAVEQVERLRAEVLSLDRRERILRENISTYEDLLICLMNLQRYEEALQVAEQGKSRTLIDLLALRDLRPHNAPPEVVAEYEQMLFRARALEDRLRRADGDGKLEERERGQAEDELRQVQEERIQVHQRLTELENIIRQHDPDFLPHAKPLTIEEIFTLSQEASAALVLFRVTEAGTFVFLVFPDRTFEVVAVGDFTTDTLNQLLLQIEGEQVVGGWVWHYYNARDRWFEVLDETLGLLYQRLLKPVHECLQRNASKMADARGGVVFVPNRGLAILPLHACWWQEDGTRKYLLDEYVIRYAPSLSVFKRCLERERAGRKRETLLAVANPTGDLVFSEWECTRVEQLIGDPQCLILWRENAEKDAVLGWMGGRHYLHFSCHGQYRLDVPLASSLRLANGGGLTLGEIFEEVYLPNSWLVMLSACETGLVDFREVADEHYGLATGFLYAGAPTVYSSLWSVADFSTALLMVKAYGGLVKEGKSKSEALRDAQLWLRDLTAGEASTLAQAWEAELRERMAWVDIAPWRRKLQINDPNARPFAHPYYWSAFQCAGV